MEELPMVEHLSDEPCHHERPCEELQDEKALRKLMKTRPGERAREDLNAMRPIEATRIWRIAQMSAGESDWDSCAVGLPRHEAKELGKPETVRVMPSQDARGRQGMRSCSRKLATAALYSTSKPHRAAEANESELRKALASIGEAT